MFKYKKLYLAQKAENEALSAANKTLGISVADMNGAVQRSANEIANLNEQLTSKHIALDKAREELAAVREEHSESIKAVTDLTKALEDVKAELASTAETSEHWMKQADELEGKLRAKEAARSSAASNLQRETEVNNGLREDIARKAAKIAELEEQIIKLLEDNENLEHSLASSVEDGNALKGRCSGCKHEGNYHKCTSCLRGHAEDKFTLVEPEISSPADNTDSSNEETVIEEGAIVGEPVNIDDIPADTDTAELKEAEAEFETTPDAEPTADTDVAEVLEDEMTTDLPDPLRSCPAPAPEDKAPAKKKPSRKKKKAAKKK